MYAADEIRLSYLQNWMSASRKPPEYLMLLDTWDGYDDLTYMQKTENGIRYFEGWVESCWEGLFEKPEYADLDKETAMRKFVAARFATIASAVKMGIEAWGFYDSVLVLDLKPIAQH